jgi:hypothetical protein
MKVAELISKLQRLDGNLDVLCICEDAALQKPGELFRLMDPVSVDLAVGQISAYSDEGRSMALGSGRQWAFLAVTADF